MYGPLFITLQIEAAKLLENFQIKKLKNVCKLFMVKYLTIGNKKLTHH